MHTRKQVPSVGTDGTCLRWSAHSCHGGKKLIKYVTIQNILIIIKLFRIVTHLISFFSLDLLLHCSYITLREGCIYI